MSIVWSRVYGASGFRDGVFSVCVSNGRVYAVGSDEVLGLGAVRYRVELYRASNGERIRVWSDEISYPYASLLSCSVLGDKLYVAGATSKFWSILEFDKELKLIRRTDFEEPGFLPFSMVIVDESIYIAGVLIKNSARGNVFIAKINPRDLTIIKSREITLNSSNTGSYVIDYDDRTNQLVLGGFIENNIETEWLILYINKELELMKTIKPGFEGVITGLVVSYDGYIYVVDGARVVKLTSEGKVLAVNENTPGVKIYVAKTKTSPLKQHVIVVSNNNVHVLASDNLKTVVSIKLPSETPLQANIGSIDSQNNYIYLALTQIALRNNWKWTMYALKIKPKGIIAKILRK